MLRGRRALVVGLLNKHSLAAGAAQALLDQGARVLLVSRHALSPAQRAACGLRAPRDDALRFAECDVEDDASVEALAARCGDEFGGRLDVLVHSVAFAPKDAFAQGPRAFLGTSRAAWSQALDVSAYSLVALTRATHPLLVAAGGEGEERAGASVVAMTYAGASRVMPSYNVMGPAKAALEAAARQLAFELGPDGIRVNCVSPGPMNTVSARGIPGISRMRKYAAEHAPMPSAPTIADVGSVTAFLASDLAASITGQTIYVDGGLSAMAPYMRDTSDSTGS